jgi:predicted ATPase
MVTVTNLDREMNIAFMRLKKAFSSFDALGAFRERPTRTYLFSGQNMKRVGKTGIGAIDMLVSDSGKRGSKGKVLIEKISEWFSRTEMAQALEIKPLTSRHFEVCVKDQSGKIHNLCDVGFGCSQVLPVLVASYSFATGREDLIMSKPTLVIQEPEIHLHPNAQAELGSVFAEIGKRGRGQLFIETHSPYLIIRLQTEVAKKTLDNADLKIFYVKKTSEKTTFTNLRVGKDGIFMDEWPDGFFSQRSAEALELARQSSKSSKN